MFVGSISFAHTLFPYACGILSSLGILTHGIFRIQQVSVARILSLSLQFIVFTVSITLLVEKMSNTSILPYSLFLWVPLSWKVSVELEHFSFSSINPYSISLRNEIN